MQTKSFSGVGDLLENNWLSPRFAYHSVFTFDCSNFIRTRWVKKVSSSLVSGDCNCFNGRSDFDLEISGGRTFSTRLVVCKDSIPVAGVSMSVTDGVCCFGAEVFSRGHASLSGRQM